MISSSMAKALFYFRPVRDTYRIMWFSADNYRAYYDAMGELDEIELIYSFTVRDTMAAPSAHTMQGGGSLRYVKLRVRRDEIKETISNEKPSFDATSSQTLAFAGKQNPDSDQQLGIHPGGRVSTTCVPLAWTQLASSTGLPSRS